MGNRHSRYGTDFLEAEAILAAQEEDDNEVDRILAQMTDVELQTLMRAGLDLANRCRIWLNAGGVEL